MQEINLTFSDVLVLGGNNNEAGTQITETAIVGGNLVFTLSDGSTLDAGALPSAKGDDGASGRGIFNASLSNGDLVLTWSGTCDNRPECGSRVSQRSLGLI